MTAAAERSSHSIPMTGRNGALGALLGQADLVGDC